MEFRKISLLLLSSCLSAQIVAHNDLNQTSWNSSETILTPSVVQSGPFQKLGTYSVDGIVFAQPLYVPQVVISGITRNALIVATLNNSIYAFDADLPGSVALWKLSLGPGSSLPTNAPFYLNPVGIVGTPVIDKTNNVFYVVSYSSTNQFTLLKVNLSTGATINSVVISGQFPGTGDTGDPTSGGNLLFFPIMEWQRPGLTLSQGKVYLAFGGHGANRPLHGWLFAYNTSDLSQAGVFCDTPSSWGASMWMSGGAPAVDASGNVYVTTGNNNNNPDPTEFGETLLKLSPTLTLLDWFTPANFATLDALDADLASNRVILIPGTSPQLAVIGGKDFNVYVVDTTCMGHLQGSNPSCNLQTFKTNAAGTITSFSGSYGSAFANNLLYLPNTSGSIYEFAFNGSSFNTTPVATQTNTYGFPGPAQMTVSSNGGSNTILWVTTGTTNGFNATTPGTLRALNTSLTELWNSGTGSNILGSLGKFVAPTVASGKVFVGTADSTVAVFGLPTTFTSQMTGQSSLSGSASIQ